MAALVAAMAAPALAFEPFVVKDIRVEGAQRTEAGTVFSYLPVKVGERMDDEKAAQAVKALFATGFFRDVRIENDNGVLVVAVQERPTISRVEFIGNKEFDTDTLKKALRDIGLAEARIFDRAALDRAEQEMKRQYISRGLYSAKVTTTATPQDRNRVAVNFTIEEGEAAKIARINIVGTKVYTEAELRSEMLLTTPGWLTWYTKNDQYSKQKLAADLEALRSFYQNRGYLEFNVESTQVSITPDKEDIYITLNISEGPRFTISDVRLAGDLPVAATELEGLICVRSGDVYSRERLQASAKAMSDRLGAEGYAFANVNAVPELDREKQQVAFTFYVDPGRRVYVRRININGNVRTRDEVIRREMRQLESAWFDGARIERSKVRVRRLGYFDDVNIETPPVPGAPDLVDVEVTVTERSTGNLLAGVGYSSADGLVFNASVSQQNIFGSGNALIAALNTSRSTGRSRWPSPSRTGPSTACRARSRSTTSSSTRRRCRCRATRRGRSGAAASFGIPITETDTVNMGLRFERTDITLFDDSPLAYREFVAQFGNPTNALIFSSGWARDTRDDILYPTRGRLQSALLEVGLPFGDIKYYKVQYVQQWFTPLFCDTVLMLRGDLGYGDGYSGKPLPFYKAFFAGGVGSVRGYEQSSLGPRDIFGNVTGGKRKIVANAELFYPILKGEKSVRASVFADAGQIYVGSGLQRDRAAAVPRHRPAGFPLLRRRRPRVELADRPAQVQLRAAAQRQAGRPAPGASSSRSARYSDAPATRRRFP